jgi:transcription antitermination factor NusG
VSWYAIQVRGRRGAERAAQTAVLTAGVWARVPRFGNTQEPILPGYVLLETSVIGEVMRLLRTVPISARYVVSVPSEPSLGGAAGLLSPAEVAIIDHLERHGVATAANMLTPESLPPGREVEITRGPFATLRARLARWEDSERSGWRMVVELPGMGRLLAIKLSPDAAKVVHEAANRKKL